MALTIITKHYKERIAYLEAQLQDKEKENGGLRDAIHKMPEFSKLSGDVCFQ